MHTDERDGIIYTEAVELNPDNYDGQLLNKLTI